MDHDDYFALILYYGRTRFYHSMQKAALEGLAKFPMQAAFRLYNGFALALGNRVQEGIRELNPLKNDSELGLGATLALKFSHLRCNMIDKDALLAVENRLKEGRNIMDAMAIYHAATFLFLTEQLQKARENADRALKLNSQLECAIILKAWIEISMQKPVLSGNILRVFEQALSRGKNITAALGQVRYFQLRGQFENAISTLNKISVRFPELSMPLIEKMNTQLAAVDWLHCAETASRICNLEPTNIPALRVKAMIILCREGNAKACANVMKHLLTTAERVEMGNFNLILSICQLFSRAASRSREILAVTLCYVDKICQMIPGSVEFMTELAYEHFMLGNLNEAISSFQLVTQVNKNYFDALCGLVLCQLSKNNPVQVEQQIELLTDLQSTNAQYPSPYLLLVKAKVTDQADRAIELLIQATEIHLRQLESEPIGTEYIRILNPDFLLQICAELLRHSPVKTTVQIGPMCADIDTTPISLSHCLSILEVIIRTSPANVQALLLKAKVELLCSDLVVAIATLQTILNEIDRSSTEAYLLLAQIQIQQKQYAAALQTLEKVLSLNFDIRKIPMYHLLMGIVQKQEKKFKNAQKSFLTAMQIVGSPYVGTSDQGEKQNIKEIDKKINDFTLSDHVTLYLELLEVLFQIGDEDEAYESGRLLQCAMDEFSNTSEEGRVVIANAELLLRKCNVRKAINVLTTILPGQSYYIQAKTRLAQIYIEHRKDRVAFAKCFQELVQVCPEKQSHLMLGEAYMSIQEPDMAVEAYQRALSVNPNDSYLARKLGRAYVKAHQYAKAIIYYQEALKNSDHAGLKLDLAELYLKLKQYHDATEILADDVEDKKINEEDIASLQQRTKQLLLLARVYEKSGNILQSMQTLQKARDNQHIVQRRICVDHSGSPDEQRKILSKICLQLAQQSISLRDNDQALKFYKECLKYNQNDLEVLSSLARLYMQMGSVELCHDLCVQILQLDNNHETASVMMADLSFRKIDFENAGYHFSQLLLSQPCYWTALARLIEVMRRSGTIAEVVPFIQRAEHAATDYKTAGLNYCKGLFNWYSGNPNSALRYFNSTRQDYEWGQQAIFNMIEICINPDGDLPIGGEIQDNADSGDFSDSRSIALKTAERLLRQLRPQSGTVGEEALNHRLLQNFLHLASKQRFQIETALQDFTDLASKDEYQNMVGPVLGMASALVLMKQTQRAKNHLKRVLRVTWNFEEAEYLERSWLLLADIYIHSNKLETGENFIQKVLDHNKSSTKAYELAGYIAEKSQNFRDAAKHYQNAWTYGGRSKSHIGYKLAYSYMKNKKYANAIDVCQQVIKINPDYVIIKKDIMNKCRQNLRP